MAGELPSSYSYRLWGLYNQLRPRTSLRKMGQFLTPPEIAAFMAGLVGSLGNRSVVRVLDPGAGTGILSCALCEDLALRSPKPGLINIEAFELDVGLREYLHSVLDYLRAWLSEKGISLSYSVRSEDFILAYAHNVEPDLASPAPDPFDVVISNPPYFKIGKSDPRAKVMRGIIHGQPNMYALFMAVSAAMLDHAGQMVFITPRSYMSGPYFQAFREYLLSVVDLVHIHLFGSRSEAFKKSSVLQESVVLMATGKGHRADKGAVTVSFSEGAADLNLGASRAVPKEQIVDTDSRHKVIRVPLSRHQEHVIGLANQWGYSLHQYGMQISTGPVVPFRAVEFISNISAEDPDTVPLIWMQNVKPMKVTWPLNGKKEQRIRRCDRSIGLLVPIKNYVLLRRFSAKEEQRRLVAAPLMAQEFPGFTMIGLENHLNYIYRPSGDLLPQEAYGLSALLNSSLLDEYFRISNGNTQVSATELRSMPFPPREAIIELGKLAMHCDVSDINGLVEQATKGW